MANERIDIEVNDKGSDKAAKGLRNIGKEAMASANYVDRLKSELASLPSAQLQALTASMNTTQAEAKQLVSSIATIENSLTGLTSRVNAAVSSLNTLDSAQARAASSASRLSTAHAASGSTVRKTNDEHAKYNRTVNAGGKAAGLAGHQMGNLVAQINDIGVSLASGQKPWLVFIQQGSQIQQLASTVEGGFGTLGRAAGGLVLRFAPVLAILGALAVGFTALKNSVASDAEMKRYAETLGLTAKEMKQLDDVTVTYGDTAKATFQVLSENILASMGFTTDEIKKYWNEGSSYIVQVMVAAFIGIAGAAHALIKAFITIGENIQTIFFNAGVGAANLFILGIQKLYNGTVKIINMLIPAFNGVFGTQIQPIKEMQTGVKGIGDGMRALKGIHPIDDMQEGMQNSLNTINRIRGVAKGMAQDRLKEQANQIIQDRTPRAGRKGRKGAEDHTAENRARALELVNNQLDNELTRMHMLKDEREVQQKFDQIEQSLLQKKIHLSDTEAASIRAKIQAVQDYARVQHAMDQIVQEVNGPLQDQNALIDAATELYDRGKISAEQYGAQLYKATEAYNKAVDPLYEMNKQVDNAMKLTHSYGVELERANYLQQIDQEYRSRGLSIYDQSTGKLRAEVAALVAKNDALRQQQFIQSQTAAVVTPILERDRELEAKDAVYAELDRMRAADLLREDQYQQAKAALAVKYQQAQLNATGDFFGALADVTKSGHGVLAGISKAAAIAQATIQGYVAIQNALAGVPFPFNIAAAAAIALKTGAQIAGILSTNVGNFATGGQFIVQGKSGVDANNINMNVTKGERVTVETKAQQRANDNGPAAAPTVLAPKIVNVWDREQLLSEIDTEDGHDLIVNVVRKKRNDVNGVLGKPK